MLQRPPSAEAEPAGVPSMLTFTWAPSTPVPEVAPGSEPCSNCFPSRGLDMVGAGGAKVKLRMAIGCQRAAARAPRRPLGGDGRGLRNPMPMSPRQNPSSQVPGRYRQTPGVRKTILRGRGQQLKLPAKRAKSSESSPGYPICPVGPGKAQAPFRTAWAIVARRSSIVAGQGAPDKKRVVGPDPCGSKRVVATVSSRCTRAYCDRMTVPGEACTLRPVCPPAGFLGGPAGRHRSVRQLEPPAVQTQKGTHS
jgi:hypothetical protein